MSAVFYGCPKCGRSFGMKEELVCPGCGAHIDPVGYRVSRFDQNCEFACQICVGGGAIVGYAVVESWVGAVVGGGVGFVLGLLVVRLLTKKFINDVSRFR